MNKQHLEDMGINTVSLGQPGYPALLKEIYDPPPLLYYRGTLPKEGINIAVVGSRNMSDYGKSVVEYILSSLKDLPFNIISGLAYGIDAEAHKTALRLRLKTTAVLGSGIDNSSIYPKAHVELAEEIIYRGGCVMSEFPPGTKGLPQHFPMRNRIVAGLSKGVVVVEAAQKSGALITARLALEQGRDVFAVPRSILDQEFTGCNNLIKLGAKVITSGNDILEEYLSK
jgi:DNA processing protein